MTTFVVGQKVRILEDRIEKDDTKGELTIVEIKKVSDEPGVGHHQIITCDNGNRYSGYWFDPECKVLDRFKNSE